MSYESEKPLHKMAEAVSRGGRETNAASRASGYDRLRIALESYVGRHAERLSAEDADRLRQRLEMAIADVEGTQGQDGSDAMTSHAETASAGGTRTSKISLRPPPSDRESMGGTRDAIVDRFPVSTGFFVGTTLMIAAIWMADAAGFVRIQTRPDDWDKMRSVQEQIEHLAPEVTAVMELINSAEVELLRVAGEKKLEETPGSDFVNLTALLPDFQERVVREIPTGTRIVVRLKQQGELAYKIVARSDLCSAASLMDSSLVDPVRKQYDFGCSYFGKWNTSGSGL